MGWIPAGAMQKKRCVKLNRSAHDGDSPKQTEKPPIA
jgi:hypothetical protein